MEESLPRPLSNMHFFFEFVLVNHLQNEGNFSVLVVRNEHSNLLNEQLHMYTLFTVSSALMRAETTAWRRTVVYQSCPLDRICGACFVCAILVIKRGGGNLFQCDCWLHLSPVICLQDQIINGRMAEEPAALLVMERIIHVYSA